LFYSLLLAIFYAVTDEYHQTLVSGRSGKILDVGIDSLGAISGLISMLKLNKYL
jgi:VanZ family protein